MSRLAHVFFFLILKTKLSTCQVTIMPRVKVNTIRQFVIV